ncbi:MAG: 4Fe-4S binding protein [Nitrospirae bacterium]|nr:MAG: 4Fe-4S binding protein [Nitrospirota bacterium]
MWRRYRRAVELLQALIIVGLPFIKIKGHSALRFDIQELKLHFFGTVIWIKEFYLVLFLTLLFLILIVYITTIFGRIWCGWLCPQTVLLDFSSDLAGLLRLNPYRKEIAQKIILLPLSALVSLSLIWYFVPPEVMLRGLFHSKIITGFFITLWVVIYAELTLLGRTFCKTICPYSMLQSGLFDSDTLVIGFEERSTEGCMGCDKCVRVCPVGIDIKKGLQRECVACAECIDACISMTKPRGIKPFIAYRGRPWRAKNLVFALLTLVIALSLAVLFALRPDVEFVVSRNPEVPIEGVNSYTYSLYNNTDRTIQFKLKVRGPFKLVGDTSITLPAYGSKRGRVLVKAIERRDRVVFELTGDNIKIMQKVGFL